MSGITVSRLQEYIREQDHAPDMKREYFMKLAEEVGELSRAMRKYQGPAAEETLKGSVEEELCDVVYYALALANAYGVDIERWFYLKEKLNDVKYGRAHAHTLLSEL